MPTRTRSFYLIPLLLLFVGGCAASSPKPAVLSLQSIGNGHGFAQTFPHAYFSQSDDGDREVVLINDGILKRPTPSAGPIQPVASLPLTQVMHFKILWNPLPDTHTDAPSTTNAIIDWTIRTARPGEVGDSLHYQGAGFVEVDGDNQRLTLTIRNATLQATGHTGILVDPLGNCSLNGEFVAYRNDSLVQATIADMQSQQSNTPVEASAEMAPGMGPAGNGPPPRTPSP
jgi:hypothetical protein